MLTLMWTMWYMFGSLFGHVGATFSLLGGHVGRCLGILWECFRMDLGWFREKVRKRSEMLENKKFHIHTHTIEDILSSNPEDVFYICDHC